ncbi:MULTISPECIES: Hsp33 family molecular chaperone HslO [Silvimonas]|uniref:Hsp33 family molecular chaperone HslO n=1 Tax=Silvimonas TaxID=300264 RepID=UPI0024B3518D|nr:MULTISPECIES: Hsp33 family molecular chaperone HslO [Silvimonas]MDR3427422.1 Hsp33 family molecular chaperone HslO [Silvimonas sp.]
MQDILERFVFEEAPVRGEIVQLHDTVNEVMSRHNYPPVLQKLIGELMAAASLLSATLKFEGTMIMQLHGSGPVKLIVVECTSEMTLRATARWDGDVPDVALGDLLGKGKFVITLDPDEGETYQGIVAYEPGQSVAQIIEHYMQHSEQLETRMWLTSQHGGAAGLLVQKMPAGKGDADAWERVQKLAETITDEELLGLTPRDVLYRLFNQEIVRVFDPQTPRFACTCSRERVGGMLKMVGREEVESVIEERAKVDVTCEFCGKEYEFDAVDVAQLFAGPAAVPAGPQVH